MAKIQRWTETQIASPGINTDFLVCRANPQRELLIFNMVNASTQVAVSTGVTKTSWTNFAIVGGTGSGRWELSKSVHGVLATTEWHGMSGAGVGVIVLVVFELIVEETSSGLWLPPGALAQPREGLLSLLNDGRRDPSMTLREQLQAATRELQNVKA